MSATKNETTLLNLNATTVYLFVIAFFAFVAFITAKIMIETMNWPLNHKFFDSLIPTIGFSLTALMVLGSVVQLLWWICVRSSLAPLKRRLIFIILVCLFPLGFIISHWLYLRHKAL